MATFRNPTQWLYDLFGGGKNGKITASAKTINHTAPFWYGINKISGNVGTLPINVMRNLNPGSEKDKSHIAWRLLRLRPNAYQTPFVFKQTETARAITWGNSRSYIHRAGRNSELIPLRPDATLTGLIEGEKYHCTKPDADDRICSVSQLIDEMRADPNGTVIIPDNDVLHIQGFGDGIVGMSLFEVARTSLEISLGSDQRTNKQMKKGFAGKVMLEAPADSPLFRDQKQAEEFLEDFKKKHGADGAADEVGMLRGGINANILQMSNRDAEFIEQRKFQRQEAALWLMLESILGDDTSVSYNSEEQKQLAYLKNCLSNWLVRWEEECSFKLLTDREFYTGSHYCKFNVGSLLRTDTKTTVETLSQGIQSRIWNPNEARAKLDENPYEGGEIYENPNITPGEPGGNDDDNEANATAIQDRLQHLLTIEESRVNTFLNRGDTTEQIEAWYSKWSDTLGNAIENLGGNRTIATEHIETNLAFLARSPKEFSLNGTAELLTQEVLKCST